MMHNYIISQEKAGFVTYSTYKSWIGPLENGNELPKERWSQLVTSTLRNCLTFYSFVAVGIQKTDSRLR
jgi:hypothetical protein